MKFNLRSIQTSMLDHLVLYNKGALWAGMGTGKTSAILYYLTIMLKIDPGKILIVAPLQVAENTWPGERDKFDDFKLLKMSTVTGSGKQRLKALSKPADIYIINFENLIWLKKFLPSGLKFKYLIIDEATRVKNLRLRKGSKNAKALFKISLNIKYIWELSGTSTIHGLITLWGQLGYIDRGERLGKTFSKFRDKYFDTIIRGDYPIYKPKAFAEEEIGVKVSDVCESFNAKDYMDIKEPIIYNVNITLPPKIQELYDKMEKEMFIELKNYGDITAWFKASATMKCMQISNGYIYKTRDDWIYLHKEKIRALQSIVAEAVGAPVLLAYQFRADIAQITEYFPQARILNTSTAKGLIPRWDKGKIQLMCGNPMSVGHGINLQHGGNILVNYSHGWSTEYRQQFYERIGPTRQAQSGYDRPVFVYNIVTLNTIDEVIMRIHMDRERLQETIDGYTRRKKIN